jgi:tRNA pseudouridine55 synthase
MTTPPSDSGVVILEKPEGMTSHDVVARIRRVLGIRRVGHAGTLDPMATGVLVVGFGRGTRLLPYLQGTAKEYTGTIRLGWATTTDDRMGEPLAPPSPVLVTAPAIDEFLVRFVGRIQQRPSAVSAVKVGGRRAYSRVRAGEQVELPPRTVDVTEFVRTGEPAAGPGGAVDVPVRVSCSTGTYVRALARDLGAAAGCGGHLVALRRTAVGPFDLSAAHPLPAPDGPLPVSLTLGAAAAAVLPSLTATPADAAAVRVGSRVATPPGAPAAPCALLDESGTLLAVAEAEQGRWRYRAVFA